MAQICKNWSDWLKRTRFSYMDETQQAQTLNWLISIRDDVLDLADIKENQKVADFGCGTGLLSFGVLERFSNKVELIFSDKFQDCLDECQKMLSEMDVENNASFLKCDIASIKLPDNHLDRAMTRSVLVHVLDKKSVFFELYRVLKKGGIYAAFEPIISENTRYYELLTPQEVSDYEEFKCAEMEFMSRKDDPLVNFNLYTLDDNLQEAGFEDVLVNGKDTVSKYIAKKESIINWFISPPAPDQKTMKQRFLEYFEEKKVDKYINEVINALGDKEITVSAKTAFIKARK